MSKSVTEKNSNDHFPHLIHENLKRQATRWRVERYPKVSIERVVLYHFSSKFQKYGNKPIKAKYAIVFELGEKDETANLTLDEERKYYLRQIRGEIPIKPYEQLIADTRYHQTGPVKERFLALITQDFTDVYREPPKDNFRDEWMFIAKCADIKLCLGVMANEPCWILYDSDFVASDASILETEWITVERAMQEFYADRFVDRYEFFNKLVNSKPPLPVYETDSEANEIDMPLGLFFLLDTEVDERGENTHFYNKTFPWYFLKRTDWESFKEKYAEKTSMPQTGPPLPEERETSLIEQVEPSIKDRDNVFLRKGKTWLVKYKQKSTTLLDNERIRYIIHLLEKPHKSTHVCSLVTLVKDPDPLDAQTTHALPEGVGSDEKYNIRPDTQKTKDESEKENINLSDMTIERLSHRDKEILHETGEKCRDQLVRAKKSGNTASIEEAEKQMEAYKNHLLNEYGVKVIVSSKGLFFRFQKKLGPEAEKARQLVKNQISEALKDIGETLPSLKQYLDQHLDRGASCMYKPDDSQPIDWYIVW